MQRDSDGVRASRSAVRSIGGATRLTALGASGLLRARALPTRDGVARVAVVQTAASLLSGDHLELRVECGPGCRLELVEVAGWWPRRARRAGRALRRARHARRRGASVRAARPLTLAAGCDLRRGARGAGGRRRALWRDTLVLGRAGEVPGRMAPTSTCAAPTPSACRGLDTGDLELLSSPVVLGAGARVLDTLALYGARGTQTAACSSSPVPARSVRCPRRRSRRRPGRSILCRRAGAPSCSATTTTRGRNAR